MGNGTIGNGFDWHQIEDHTSFDTNGKCLIVNAATDPGEFYKTTITGLCENTTYEFSAWLINLVKANSFCATQPGGTIPINVSFEIWDATDANLLARGVTGNIAETSNPNWEKYGLVFETLASQNTVILKMINNGVGGCGNDLAIDDIEFKSCGDYVTTTEPSNSNAVSLCSTETPYNTTLTATPDFSVYSTHFYQWQISYDGVIWNDITSETNASLPVSISATSYYRTKIAQVAINLSNPQCVSFSTEYKAEVAILPPTPTLSCWQTATLNSTTCDWDITGTQPIQPTLECWQNATFNTATCSWDITGSQAIAPTTACYETATFNTSTCAWDVTGTQPIQPTLECWQNATFNTATCSWDITGSQAMAPTTACYETAAFNTTTCAWDVTGTQPIQPTLECWQSTTFNTTTCSWDIFGDQPGFIFENDIELCEFQTLILEPETSIANASYLWNTGETTETITIDSSGRFSVEITGNICDYETRIFNISTAETPLIETVTSHGNDIVISTLNMGNFLYSIDGNIFQPNSYFYNVDGGLYTIYVKSQNCSDIVTQQFLHFYIPKFFTPNNDGINDSFNLSGIEQYSASEVSIFDRYGKLLKFAKNSAFEWDGTYKNNQLSTGDYWYVIIIDGQKLTGHFTLKR
ncbi:T9SS type B sorting domain-containing protein [Algibacter miyuki]|uniref:T9SS type B sorting domain-containing protein n=1 Tax=Algibacter miyuki TaxID=1306933 RepID=A0ABV5GW06_9FLAO